MSIQAGLVRGLFFSRNYKRVSARLVVLLVFFGGAFLGCQRPEAEQERAADLARDKDGHRPQAVRVVSPRGADLLDSLNYIGTVHRQQTTKVLARVPATVLEVHVEEGDAVTKGAALIRMSAPELLARAERLGAEIARVQVEQEFQCETARTDQELAEEGVLTRALAEASLVRCRGATSALQASQAALKEAEDARSRLVEVAPVEGMILERLVEPGEFVAPGRPLFVLGAGPLEISAAITEGDLQRGIRVGTEVQVRSRWRAARGTVQRLAPMARGPDQKTDRSMRRI